MAPLLQANGWWSGFPNTGGAAFFLATLPQTVVSAYRTGVTYITCYAEWR